MSRAEKDRYGALESSLDKLAVNATNPPPARAMVLADLPEPYQPHIFKRGNPSRLGEEVPRAFPAVLTGGEPGNFTEELLAEAGKRGCLALTGNRYE